MLATANSPADVDPALVAADVVDAVRDRFAKGFIDEIVDAYGFGLSLRIPLTTAVLERPHELLLLRVDRNYRVAGRVKGIGLRVDVFELRVSVGMLFAFDRLPIRLKAVAQLLQQSSNGSRTDAVAHATQLRRKTARTFGSPSEG